MMVSGKLAATLVVVGLAGGMGELTQTAGQHESAAQPVSAQCSVADYIERARNVDRSTLQAIRQVFGCASR
jgi:hypothetical protein